MANVIKIPTRTTFGLSKPTIKIFGISGYYSPPRDCVVKVHLIGGGGGGANGGYPNNLSGGGGGYVQKTLRVKAGISYNVTIGAGGSGGAETTNQPYSPYANLLGTAGGNTSFMSYDIEPIIAYGGGGSALIPGSPNTTPGAIGGWGAGGDVILQGGHGHAKGAAGTSGNFFFSLLGPLQPNLPPTAIAAQEPISGGQYFSTNSPPSYTMNRGGFGYGGAGGSQFVYPWQPSVIYKGGGGPGGFGLVVIEEY